MRSMTGFGSYVYNDKKYDISVEIKSVNHRFLDLAVYCNSEISHLEYFVREEIKSSIKRAKVHCSVKATSKEVTNLELDHVLLERVYNLYAEAYRLKNKEETDIDMREILKYEGIITHKQSKLDSDEFVDKLKITLDKALERYEDMILNEGEQTKNWLIASIERMNNGMETISEYIPEYREELKKKFENTLREVFKLSIDGDIEKRILTEVSFYMDKYDVTEEIVRLKDHLEKTTHILNTDGRESGKKLNFIIQEMHREIQTISAKLNSVSVFPAILSIKEEVEKCRELVQNVE